MYNQVTLVVDNISVIELLNILNANSIPITNYHIIDGGSIRFAVGNKYYKKLVGILNKKCYNINVVKGALPRRMLAAVYARLGLAIGIVAVIIMSIILSNFTFYIKVMGNSEITTKQVIECLNSYGIYTGKINRFDNQALEKYISSNLDQVSLVSVQNIGNTITINIKEKLPNITTFNRAIVAPQNMLITSIDVIKGTSNYKVGDIVKKGDIIVYPYYIDHSNNKVDCEPIARVVGDTWFCGTVKFSEDYIDYVRTGKVIDNCEYYLGSAKVYSHTKQNAFSTFQTENYEYNISKILLPITVKGVRYFETQGVPVHSSIEDNKAVLIDKAYNIALQNVPSGYAVIDRNDSISKVGDTYIISVYLKSVVEVNNVN